MIHRSKAIERLWQASALLTVLSLLAVPGAWAQKPAKAGDLRVVLPPGDVARGAGAQMVKTNAKKGMPLLYQDLLETGVGGRLRGRLDDGSILALGPQSSLRVVQHNAQTQQTDLQLEYGKVRAQVIKLTQPNAHFEVQTNTAVAGVIGTDEIVDAFSPVATMVICVEGRLQVRNANPNVPGSVILNTGEVTIINQGAVPTPPRPATAAEMQAELDGTTGAAPQAVADIGNGLIAAGQNLVLDGSDSFATGGIATYHWTLTHQGDTAPVYNQTLTAPRVSLDTASWQPGHYNGTLGVVTPTNATAQIAFRLVVLPPEDANSSPDELIRELQQAYESLQPTEFMRLFDPDKYSGYAALQASIESSFRNLSRAQVFVRRANGEILEGGHEAIYQVDFEVHFSTKQHPDLLYVVDEQATLRMEQSDSPWLITDVPQGALGSPGIPGIPGVSDPTAVNNPAGPANGQGGTVALAGIPNGGSVIVPSGGSGNTISLQNTAPTPVTVSFTLPPGITLDGDGAPGTMFTIPANQLLGLVFAAAPGTPGGTYIIPTILHENGSTLPGPDITVTVTAAVQLSVSIPGTGGSAGNPVPVLLGGAATATLTASSNDTAGHAVNLTGSGGNVSTSFSPNPVSIPQGSSSANSTVTISAASNAPPGAGQVAIAGASGNASATTTLFVNRVAPFTLSMLTPVVLAPSQSAPIAVGVAFNAPFTGPAVVTAPQGASGITFSPPSVTLNSSGNATFTVTAGQTLVSQPISFTFVASAGGFSQSAAVAVSVVQAIDFSLAGSSISLQAGQNGSASATVAFISGTPQSVTVAVQAGSVNTSLITVTGGGTAPNASGTVNFNVSALASAAPGTTTFTVTGTSGATTRTATITVTILAAGNTGFTMTSDPAVWFLGNGSPLTLLLQRDPSFSGPVTVQVGTLPPGIADVQPRSAVIAAGSSSLTLQVTAANDPVLDGRSINIPFTGNGGTGSAPFTAPGTLQAPFTAQIVIGNFNSDLLLTNQPIEVGDTANEAVGVTFAPNFPGTVAVSGNASGGLSVASSPVVLSASGVANVLFTALLPGNYSPIIQAQAGNFVVLLHPSVVVTSPPFSLQVSPSPTLIQFNDTLATTIQVQVVPQGTGFNQTVTVTVPDGKQVAYYANCSPPAGFVSYTGGVLTFTVDPPYNPVTFCMQSSLSAPIVDSTSITGFASGVNPVQVPVNLRVGVPQVVVTRVTTFNIGLGASVTANVAVNSIQGFSLPVQLRIAGPASYLTYFAPLPSEFSPGDLLASSDCDPAGPGKTVQPNSATTCTLQNVSAAGDRLPLSLVAIVAYPVAGPQTSAQAAFQVCDLGPSIPSGCGVGIQGSAPGLTTQRQPSGGAQLGLDASSISFAPRTPREGDPVYIRARVSNSGSTDAQGVAAALVVNGQTVATRTIDVPAGGVKAVDWEWKAAYDPALRVAIQLDPNGQFASSDATSQTVTVSNLFVEKGAASAQERGRQSLEIRNGECGGLRFLSGVGSFCGGGSDLEVMPALTSDGQVQVQGMTMNGGLIDLGPMGTSGTLDLPESGYSVRADLEAGHLYAVQSRGKYALVYVGRVRSEVDPRLAASPTAPGAVPSISGLNGAGSDSMADALLDHALISVEVQWVYGLDGSKHLSYSFSSAGANAPPRTVPYRQPRQPTKSVTQ